MQTCIPMHRVDSKDLAIHVLDRRAPATKTHPARTIHKDEYDYLYGWIRKRSHTQKSHEKWWTQRNSWEGRRRTTTTDYLEARSSGCNPSSCSSHHVAEPSHLDPIWRLGQAQQIIIFRLHKGHCDLSAHLKKTGISDTSLCECGQADQTPDYVLQSCPIYTERCQLTWPQGADLVTKLWVSAEDLYWTAGFVASAGQKVWPAQLSIAEEEEGWTVSYMILALCWYHMSVPDGVSLLYNSHIVKSLEYHLLMCCFCHTLFPIWKSLQGLRSYIS